MVPKAPQLTFANSPIAKYLSQTLHAHRKALMQLKRTRYIIRPKSITSVVQSAKQSRAEIDAEPNGVLA